MEKVIREWKVIETDDGFRIEIKGDKEAMRGWMKHFRGFAGRRRWHHRPTCGPWHGSFAHHPFGCCEDEEAEAEGPAED